MNASTTRQAIQLYRKLMRYSNELKFTDQEYFRQRIRKEFRRNKNLESATDIEFNIKVRFCLFCRTSINLNLETFHNLKIILDWFYFQKGEALLQRKSVV